MAAVCFRLIKVILGATQTSSVLCNKTKINKCIFTKYKLQINMLRTASRCFCATTPTKGNITN